MKSIIKFSTFILLLIFFFHLSCKKELSCENCKDGNKPPIANAGADQVIALPKDSVKLDGAASTDPDGTIVSYKWIKISGPLSTNILKIDSSKTIVKTLVMGVYKFELTVTDNGGLSAKDTVQTIVNDPAHNQPPVANAGVDQLIALPTDSVLLNGNPSFDPDGTIVSYQWTKISGPLLFNILSPTSVQSKVNGLIQGVYQFELTVTDNGGLIGKDTIQVSVNTTSLSNLPPVANAGANTAVNYDLQTCSMIPSSITLNGSASKDPDGIIVSYQWSTFSSAVISNPQAAITQASNCMPGINEFYLRVTDNSGASGTDTVVVNVINLLNRPSIPAQLVPIGTLSQTRSNIAVGAANNKILFAGGLVPNNLSGSRTSSRVDIYDVITNTWTIAELDLARSAMAVTASGNKIFFAGGDLDGAYSTTRIDIYNALTNTWTKDDLSQSRRYAGAGAAGNKVVFAGGYYQIGFGNLGQSNQIDMYDNLNNTWSVSALSVARLNSKASTVGNRIYFAGGAYSDFNDYAPYSRIDVYDNAGSSWSTSELNEPKDYHATIAVNNKLYWAGGLTYRPPDGHINTSNQVEIRDASTQLSTFACLFQANSGLDAVVRDNKIVFFTGHGAVKDKFDIYDVTSNTWSIGVLSQNIEGAAIISVNNIIYVAGGYVNGVLSNQVWKLDF